MHFEAVRLILRYVKGTMDNGILFKKIVSCDVIGYCYMFSLGSGIVSWCSTRQPTICLSSTKAEYKAEAMATQ